MQIALRLLILGLPVLPFADSLAVAQDRVLIGHSTDGGEVFQTLVHRGSSSLRSVMEAHGQGSRTESHARLDDANEVLDSGRATPQGIHARTLPRQTPSAERKQSPPHADGASPSHLLVHHDGAGAWRSLGLTSDLAKAKHTIGVLRQMRVDAHLFQFLPLPPDSSDPPLIPGRRTIGVAVALSGDVYAVTATGELFVVQRDGEPVATVR